MTCRFCFGDRVNWESVWANWAVVDHRGNGNGGCMLDRSAMVTFTNYWAQNSNLNICEVQLIFSMSCQRFYQHITWSDKPNEILICQFLWRFPDYFLLLCAHACEVRGVTWDGFGICLAFADPFFKWHVQFLNCKGVCQMIPLSPENLIFIVRYHHIYHVIKTVKKERGLPCRTRLWWQEGGGNFLIDGYQILKDLEADPETRLGWEGRGKQEIPLVFNR